MSMPREELIAKVNLKLEAGGEGYAKFSNVLCTLHAGEPIPDFMHECLDQVDLGPGLRYAVREDGSFAESGPIDRKGLNGKEMF